MTIADLTLAPDVQSVLECIMGFAFVQADFGTMLDVGIEQLIDDEEHPFNPSDFPHCVRRLILLLH
jgi:hypothetical protein